MNINAYSFVTALKAVVLFVGKNPAREGLKGVHLRSAYDGFLS